MFYLDRNSLIDAVRYTHRSGIDIANIIGKVTLIKSSEVRLMILISY